MFPFLLIPYVSFSSSVWMGDVMRFGAQAPKRITSPIQTSAAGARCQANTSLIRFVRLINCEIGLSGGLFSFHDNGTFVALRWERDDKRKREARQSLPSFSPGMIGWLPRLQKKLLCKLLPDLQFGLRGIHRLLLLGCQS